MKLNGKQVTLASGHSLEDEVIIVQYSGSFPGGTTGELKQWHALRKAGSATTLEAGPGGAPIAVQVISVGAVRSGTRPNDPAHTVYVEVRRVGNDAVAPEASTASAPQDEEIAAVPSPS